MSEDSPEKKAASSEKKKSGRKARQKDAAVPDAVGADSPSKDAALQQPKSSTPVKPAEAAPAQQPTPAERKFADKIVPRTVEDEMKRSYIDYAMSVIVARALPDVRDGLKPVHRRILYGMNELGMAYNRAHKKSARICGDVMGKYHPHGDLAIYDALVRMAQDFSLRAPLVDGQGNFGSVDGDSPAASRYTECRMSRIAGEMLADIEKETVDFVDNYDATLKEPAVLPSGFPNLLVNGSAGIAVGMATNIPPHNLGEIVDGLTLLLDNPSAETIDLMNVIKAPDFPTGGTIYGIAGIVEAYNTGRGRIRVRAKTHIEEVAKDKNAIIVTEIPYQVNKSKLVENIAELVKDKRVEGITDLRDESDREGMRVVIELRRDASEEIVLNQLFKHTQMETTFGIINLALVDGQPKILTLREMLQHYIEFRRVVVRRRTAFDLRKAEERDHIIEGLLIALDNLDEVIRIIRKSKSGEEAANALIARFLLDEVQAKAILDMRLQKLAATERQAVKDEHVTLVKTIADLKDILEKAERVTAIIRAELVEIKNRYADERRTDIVTDVADMEIEDLIPIEDVVVTVTHTGYIKRLPLETYREQHRGGKGRMGMETKEEDHLTHVFVTSTHDYIMFFTNLGRVHWLKAWKVPVGGTHAKGKAIVNLLSHLEPGEQIHDMMSVKEFDDQHFLIFATRRGKIKKTRLDAYKHVRVTGIIALGLEEADSLVDTKLSDGTKEIIIATRNGQAVRFDEKGVRTMGRPAKGVRGIRLKKGDEVVSMEVVDPTMELLTLTENGYGKRSPVEDYRKTKRGGSGVRTVKITDKTGKVVGTKPVTDKDALIITSKSGMVIRVPIYESQDHQIRSMGRSTQGVRIMRLEEGDRVMALAKIVASEEEEKVVEEAAESAQKPKMSDADFAGLKEEKDDGGSPGGGEKAE
jgi:DNA gyrase subunit A